MAARVKAPSIPCYQARPPFGPADLEMLWLAWRRLCELALEQQRPTEESGRAFRHGLHVEQAPVPPEWRDPKPLRDAWQRAADKRAWQISAPLDQVVAANRQERKRRQARARRPANRAPSGLG
jgi:hypothetical protein